MKRAVLFSLWVGLLFAGFGCQKSADAPSRAVVAEGGLLTPASPALAADCVADQKQVKLVARAVSYDSLETYRQGGPVNEEDAAGDDWDDEDEDEDGDDMDEDEDDLDDDEDDDDDDEDEDDDDGI